MTQAVPTTAAAVQAGPAAGTGPAPVLELIDVVKEYPGDPPVVALAGVDLRFALAVPLGELAQHRRNVRPERRLERRTILRGGF